MRRPLFLLVMLFACGTDSSEAQDTDLGSSSSTGGTTTSTSTSTVSTSSISATGGSTSTSTSTSADDGEDSSDSGASSTSTGGCSLGTPGCPCDGKACENGLACIDSRCTPPAACEVDLLEPNGEETAPTLLGEISDDDDDGGSIFGTLDGPDDVDWYRYRGDDDTFASVDPARFVKADGPLRLCKFAECDNGLANTQFECPAETEDAISPEGRPGCCAPLGIALGDADCDDNGLFDDDSMQVYMRIDQAAEACVAYELIYHF